MSLWSYLKAGHKLHFLQNAGPLGYSEPLYLSSHKETLLITPYIAEVYLGDTNISTIITEKLTLNQRQPVLQSRQTLTHR